MLTRNYLLDGRLLSRKLNDMGQALMPLSFLPDDLTHEKMDNPPIRKSFEEIPGLV